MTDRDKDKLIKIVRNSVVNNDDTGKLVNDLVDDLIRYGVILPPCKVGDKVYFDTYLHENSVGVQSHKVINVKYVITTEPWKGGIGAEIYDYYFGKTVFLTREEAEKALKERETK